MTAPRISELSDIPIHKLSAAARKVAQGSLSRTVRIAILGDAATQHYTQTLGAILKLRGYWPEIYEAEYDTLHLEILNPQSSLYAHKPQFVILFNCVQAALSRFVGVSDKEGFAEEYLTELQMLWEKLNASCPARIIQHTLALPVERPLGNQTLAQKDCFLSNVARINAGLVNAASNRRVVLVDTEFEASFFGKAQWFDERLWCQAKQALSPSFLPSLTKTVSDTILSELGSVVKCVVLDLDNTLWGGILGDEGPDNIEIGYTDVGLVFRRFQYAMLELKRRGLLLAICSKNHLEPVLSVLDNHPDMVLRRSDFAAIVANYEDKVSNIREIQKKLNIGFDSMVFFDDSPFERDHVRTALPEVHVPELPEDPADYLKALATWNLFEGKLVTEEDRNRQQYYQADEERASLKSRYANFNTYLQDLKMKAIFFGFSEFTLPRVLQLVQRSNQFNLTTIRYGEAELKAIGADRTYVPICIQLTDRIGDNGIIAVVILRQQGQDMHINTWIMSCRVLGRGVEEVTLNRIVTAAKEHNCSRVVGRYIATPKNSMVADLYPRFGFTEASQTLGAEFWTLDVSGYTPRTTFIELSSEVGAL